MSKTMTMVVALSFLMLAIIHWWSSFSDKAHLSTPKISLPAQSAAHLPTTETKPKLNEAPIFADEKPPVEPITRMHYSVKLGDTLSGIFSQLNLSYQTLEAVLAADDVYLQLDMIKPGEQLEFEVSHEGELLRLIYHVSLVNQVIYTRDAHGHYVYAEHELESEWRAQLYSGEVIGSFSQSAYKLGLSSTQIANITHIFRDKIDFSRSLRAGDRFDVLLQRQFLGEHATGAAEIQAMTFHLNRGMVSAFLAEDGRFYDRDGQSLERAFDRYPIDEAYRRITSAFNPRRKHPVTGKIAPHNGTDFATPVGANVYSIGDGRVAAVRQHPYAGNYVIIEHNNVYKTRYLHLDRVLVKKGERVKRGEKIALSGNTGRSTGPHLHFELLVRGRAVDAMVADIPIARELTPAQKDDFLTRVMQFDELINTTRLGASVDSSKSATTL